MNSKINILISIIISSATCGLACIAGYYVKTVEWTQTDIFPYAKEDGAYCEVEEVPNNQVCSLTVIGANHCDCWAETCNSIVYYSGVTDCILGYFCICNYDPAYFYVNTNAVRQVCSLS